MIVFLWVSVREKEKKWYWIFFLWMKRGKKVWEKI